MPKQKRALSSSQPPVLASTELKLHSRYFPYGKSVLSPDSRTSETLSRSREVAREGRDAVVTGQAVGKSVAPSKRPENQAESMLAQIVVVPAKRKAPKQRRKPAMTSMIPDKTLRLVLREPHCDRSVKMPFRLLAVRPRLLQSYLFHTPWWLLIAVILLNKTTGKAAEPVFWEIKRRWPTMEALSQAYVPELRQLLIPLGLGFTRTDRLIRFANTYLHDPPSPSKLRVSRATPAKGETKYPPTMVSHLPGMGKYALDSFRLFCGKLVGDHDWRNVMPLDKELRVYARWRWATLGLVWDAERGVIGPANERYLNDLCEGNLSPKCLAPGYIPYTHQG